MEEIKNKSLKLIKEYYENFYNRYAAAAPEKVKKIGFFLDWLKTATENDITTEKKTYLLRNCEIESRVDFFWHVGGPHFYQTFNFNVIFVNDANYAQYFTDVYESSEASSKIIPASLSEVVTEESKKALYAADKDAVFSSCKYAYDITDPKEDEYISCVLTYPYSNGKTTVNKQFRFIVRNDKVWVKNAETLGENPSGATSGGCYIATAVYGSYDCPQVWTLRRYRDETLARSPMGRAFIRLYYAISPTLVKLFGNTSAFKKLWKKRLDKKVKKLNDAGVENTPYNDIEWKK